MYHCYKKKQRYDKYDKWNKALQNMKELDLPGKISRFMSTQEKADLEKNC